jgi:hypothetical protein
VTSPARTCLHCALSRALRAGAPTQAAVPLRVRVSHPEPVWLPVSGATLYRGLRSLFREVATHAAGGPVHVTVLDTPGKSHVEVTAAFPSGGRTRILSRAFPRFEAAALAGGFVEQAGGWT